MMRQVNLPKPTGEYAVGTFTYTVKDDREEALEPGTMRSVAARVYYPAEKESVQGFPKATALSDEMLKAFKRSFMAAPDFKKNPEANLSDCYPDAPKIPGKKFPLILFNPGYSSYREGNSFLCIDLASHGYVVICTAHALEDMCTEFDDGSVLFAMKGLSRKTYQPMLPGVLAMYKLMKARGSDEELVRKFDEAQRKYCSFMMERLPEWVKDTETALRYARENLADLIDFDRGIGATGHSFGGNTAYALCARNPDFACGINMDGALFGDYTNDVQTKPFLQVSCKDNEFVVTRVYLNHTKPVYKVLFHDMKHMGFSDAKYRIPMKSVVGKLDPDVLHKNLCRIHREFFDAYLKKIKEEPEICGNEAITVSVYQP
ncbi:MAG: hypothetical protein IKS18_12020 [Lachnospiraceae bacterium]|nr:hypothetical protein [Lachnospiraceae bacterium]